MMEKLMFVFVLIAAAVGQIYFPPDETATANYNFTALQEQGKYEETVDALIAKGITKLTIALDRAIARTRYAEVDSTVFAPINIAGVLALLLMGSTGTTFQEISNILNLTTGVDARASAQNIHRQFGRMLDKLDRTSTFEPGEQVKLAAAFFIQDGFPIRELYKKTSEEIYKSEVLNVDFEGNPDHTKNLINAWVSDRTKGKITTMLIDSPPRITKIVIASAFYFKAAWENPFFEGVTRQRPFYTYGRKSKAHKMANMMSNGGLFPYYYDNILDCEIMGFPYKGNKSTMYVVMPRYSSKDKLQEFQSKLTPADLDRLVDNTRYKQSVILFPKMKLESSIDMTSILKDLGVKALFSPREANLALLSPGIARVAPPLSINNNAGFAENSVRNPISPLVDEDGNSVLIFSRFGVPLNCTEIFDPTSNITKCEEIDPATKKQVIYKKFDNKVGRRLTREASSTKRRVARQGQIVTLDNARQILGDTQNPGLYVDQVLHKVYMDITESGTEAAAATSVSLTRGGDIVTFRVDVPFLFFIRSQDTKLILFWGTVNTPSPSFS